MSPSPARKYAISKDIEPTIPPTIDPNPCPFFLNPYSINIPMSTAPQPIKIAEEYKLVTGGYPERKLLIINAKVCGMAVIVISEAENLINFSFLNIQPTQLVRKTIK